MLELDVSELASRFKGGLLPAGGVLLHRLPLVVQPVRVARGIGRRLYLARRPLRLSAGRAVLLERVLDGRRDYIRITSASAPSGRVFEPEGVVAAVIPTVPNKGSSMMNRVVYERADELAAALEELAATYDEAGVEASVVNVPAVDGEARRLLKRAGYRLVDSLTAMARELRDTERPADNRLEMWTAEGDPGAMAAICDRAFAPSVAPFARTFHGRLPDRARVYLASLDGEPASCALAVDHDGDCAVDLVATVPEAQGRGLSTALLAQALADAAKRGCATTTVAASRQARSVYERLGYRPVCPLQQWERRRPAAQP